MSAFNGLLVGPAIRCEKVNQEQSRGAGDRQQWRRRQREDGRVHRRAALRNAPLRLPGGVGTLALSLSLSMLGIALLDRTGEPLPMHLVLCSNLRETEH